MNRLLLSAAAAVLTTFGTASAARADFVLDSFNTPSPGSPYFITFANANPYTQTDKGISTGVDRTVTVLVNAPPLNLTSANGIIGGGSFSMNTDDASKATSTITYALSGAASNLTGASGLELAFARMDSGNTASGAAANTPVTVTVVTSTGTLTAVSSVNNSAGPITKTFGMGSFTGSGNLANVKSITITINGGSAPQTAVDFTLDEIRVKAVPAPPGLILAGVGLVGLVGRSRFLRKPAA